jgi:histidyl-tRNA synthetase
MSIQKPTIPKGTRDFGPDKMVRRTYLLNTIKATFRRYGFLPLETPTMENLSVLTGKYGDEGDQLLFKVLNSGDYLAKVKSSLSTADSKSLTPQIAEKGLRYDLTVPFARYVVMNRNDITFPFRRYQIQTVWRADRPQKGRYREFVQCDADVVGTDSLLCEAEIIMMLSEIFTNLKIDGYEIVINSRKILTGIAQYLGSKGMEAQLTVAMDKLEKIGEQGVYQELGNAGFTNDSIDKLKPILALSGSSASKLTKLTGLLQGIEPAEQGLNEIAEIFSLTTSMQGDLSKVNFDPSLARGLSYYTGAIFEVRMLDGSIGSVSGGGRYDDLTGVFGLPDVSGVGISLGVDRIYDVLETRGLFPGSLEETTQVMLTNFGDESLPYCLKVLGDLRSAGITAELYPDAGKLKKQMNYANRRKIPYVVLIGSEELGSGNVTVKEMSSGEQQELTVSETVKLIKGS